MIKAVSALRLAVADVERSLAFYKMLGFQEVPTEGAAREVRSNWFRIRLEAANPNPAASDCASRARLVCWDVPSSSGSFRK